MNRSRAIKEKQASLRLLFIYCQIHFPFMYTPSLYLFFFFVFLLPFSSSSAQVSPNTAPRAEAIVMGLEDIQLIDQMMVYIPGIGSPSREALTRQNIKAYMMPIREALKTNQEWAYALADCLEYYANLNNNFKDNLSPDYISLSLAAAGNRPNIEDGFKFLIQQGTVSAAIVNYGSEQIPRAVFNVPRYQITNFAYLFHPTTRARNRIFELRKALSRGNPVIVELQTAADFSAWRQSEYNSNLPTTESHYLTVVGYDEDTELFELRSAFGRHWANSGYVYMNYEQLAQNAQSAYVLIPK